MKDITTGIQGTLAASRGMKSFFLRFVPKAIIQLKKIRGAHEQPFWKKIPLWFLWKTI